MCLALLLPYRGAEQARCRFCKELQGWQDAALCVKNDNLT
jgi:hypothetical protein